MAFYEEMAKLARELLTPDSEGGLGQVSVELIRTVFAPDPLEPWGEPVATSTSEFLRAAAFVVRDGSSGYSVGETTILTGDTRIISAVPQSVDWIPGGPEKAVITVKISDGIEMQVVLVNNIPEAGLTCAVEIFARGPKR